MEETKQAKRQGTWVRSAKRWVPLAVLLGLVIGFVVVAVSAQRSKQTGRAAADKRRQPQPVNVAIAKRGAIQSWVFAEGTARAVQREYLTFELPGRVTFVEPDKAGVAVKKDDVLAELDQRKYVADVDAAQASLAEAKTQATAAKAEQTKAETQLGVAKRDYQRVERLVSSNAASQSELEQAQARYADAQAAARSAEARVRAAEATISAAEARLSQAKVALEDATIVSPIDGVVAYLNIEEGWYFRPEIIQTQNESAALGTIPIVVIDPSQFEITVDIPAYEAGRVRVGQPVIIMPGGSSQAALLRLGELEVKSPGGVDAADSDAADSASEAEATSLAWTTTGQVYAVNPAINPGGRSIQIEIRTDDTPEALRDGMFVTCWIATEQESSTTIAPFDAFLYEENRPYVYRVDPETGRVQRRDVTLGIQGLRTRQIVSGAQPGDALVTQGRFRLADEAPVKVLSQDTDFGVAVELDQADSTNDATP